MLLDARPPVGHGWRWVGAGEIREIGKLALAPSSLERVVPILVGDLVLEEMGSGFDPGDAHERGVRL